jgi:2-iminobutanoate/2-iminopropanoate deaminase
MARRKKAVKKAVRKTGPRPARRKRAAKPAQPRVHGYGTEPGFPISLAMRAGDYIFTSAQGDHEFDPALVTYDERGLVVSDGNTLPPRSVADETRSVLRNLDKALKLAGSGLEDVVDASVWLRDPRDFHEMNKAYGEFFKKNQPTRSIFRIDFMFDCRVEIKVTAYRPLSNRR